MPLILHLFPAFSHFVTLNPGHPSLSFNNSKPLSEKKHEVHTEFPLNRPQLALLVWNGNIAWCPNESVRPLTNPKWDCRFLKAVPFISLIHFSRDGRHVFFSCGLFSPPTTFTTIELAGEAKSLRSHSSVWKEKQFSAAPVAKLWALKQSKRRTAERQAMLNCWPLCHRSSTTSSSLFLLPYTFVKCPFNWHKE